MGIHLARSSPFLEILENVVPFATGSCRKFKAYIWLNGKSPKSLYALACAAWRPRSSAQTSQDRGIETVRRLAFARSLHALLRLRCSVVRATKPPWYAGYVRTESPGKSWHSWLGSRPHLNDYSSCLIACNEPH